MGFSFTNKQKNVDQVNKLCIYNGTNVVLGVLNSCQVVHSASQCIEIQPGMRMIKFNMICAVAHMILEDCTEKAYSTQETLEVQIETLSVCMINVSDMKDKK